MKCQQQQQQCKTGNEWQQLQLSRSEAASRDRCKRFCIYDWPAVDVQMCPHVIMCVRVDVWLSVWHHRHRTLRSCCHCQRQRPEQCEEVTTECKQMLSTHAHTIKLNAYICAHQSPYWIYSYNEQLSSCTGPPWLRLMRLSVVRLFEAADMPNKGVHQVCLRNLSNCMLTSSWHI